MIQFDEDDNGTSIYIVGNIIIMIIILAFFHAIQALIDPFNIYFSSFFFLYDSVLILKAAQFKWDEPV